MEPGFAYGYTEQFPPSLMTAAVRVPLTDGRMTQLP